MCHVPSGRAVSPHPSPPPRRTRPASRSPRTAFASSGMKRRRAGPSQLWRSYRQQWAKLFGEAYARFAPPFTPRSAAGLPAKLKLSPFTGHAALLGTASGRPEKTRVPQMCGKFPLKKIRGQVGLASHWPPLAGLQASGRGGCALSRIQINTSHGVHFIHRTWCGGVSFLLVRAKVAGSSQA